MNTYIALLIVHNAFQEAFQGQPRIYNGRVHTQLKTRIIDLKYIKNIIIKISTN